MKVIGCKSVSKEIDELESGQLPDANVQAHLKDCGTCRNFYDERQKLRQMIAGLETVEAPGDFDFRLRARLANLRAERPSAFSSFGFGLPSIGFAVLAILIGVGIYLRATNDSVSQQPLAKSEATKTGEPVAVRPSNPASVKSELSASASPESAGPASIEEPPTAVKQRVRTRKGNRSSNSNMVRRDDFLARSETSAMFPLEAAEPLRVSVDYATGDSRTISLPAVSFGSQQVVARGASMVKTSARTVW
ncbi:MAG TPA: hypothetical protein VFH15_09045 [Pyrinomonadaceae bacterium]|nr:hypothetical protein [Pyrinomonadaceae bacterium]